LDRGVDHLPNRMPLLMPRAEGGIRHTECRGMDCPVPGQAITYAPPRGSIILRPDLEPREHIFLIR